MQIEDFISEVFQKALSDYSPKLKIIIRDSIRELLSKNDIPSRGSPKTYLKEKQVLEKLNISSGKLFYLRRSGKLPFTKIDGIIRYSIEDIENMMETFKIKNKK